MIAAARDELDPLYRVMLALGGAAAAVLALGLGSLLWFAAPGQRSGLSVPVTGVYAYDPAAGRLRGGPAGHFAPDQAFAAEVDWAGLPATTVVGAHWYDSLGQEAGGLGPEAAGALAERRAPVVERVPPGLRANLPGRYTLVVARYQDSRPVEQLARLAVMVDRGG